MGFLTASKENYVKAIYKLDCYEAGVRITDIAEAMCVTKASTCRAVAQLEKLGLAERFGKHRVGLTEKGKQVAVTIENRFETIRLFLVEVLCLDGKIAAKEACKLEHMLSDSTLFAMSYRMYQDSDWPELAKLAPC